MKRKLLLFSLMITLVVSAKAVTVSSSSMYFDASYTSDCTPATVTFTSLTMPVGAIAKKINFDNTGYVNWTGATTNFTYTTANTWDVWVSYQNSSGTTIAYDYVRLEIHGQPGPVQADYGATQSCPGDMVRFRVSQGWESNSTYSYSWNWGDGSPVEISSYNDLNHAYANPGNYTITVTTTGTCGGPYTSTGTFNVNTSVPLPTSIQNSVYIGGDDICPGQDIYFSYPEDYSTTFVQWGDGTYSTTFEHIHEYLQTGTYYPQVTIVNGCGFSYTFQDTINVLNNLPWSPSMWYDYYNSSPVCPGEEVYFQTWIDAASYEWRDGQGNLLSSTNYYQQVFNNSDVVSLTVENGCGFDTTLYTNVSVVSNIPIDPNEFDPYAADSVCSGSSFTYTGQFFSDNNENYVYTWDFGDGNTTVGFSGDYQYASNGNYTITVTATNSCGMDTTSTLNVYVGPGVAPDVNSFFYFIPENAEVCPGDSAFFVGLYYVTGNTYSMDFGDGFSSSTPDILNIFGAKYFYFKHPYTSLGTFTTTLTVTNSCGLSAQRTMNVDVGTNMALDFGAFYDEAANICLGDPINFYGWGASQYIWSFGDGSGVLVTNSVMEPVSHIYEDPGSYTITVQGSNSCGNGGVQEINIVVPDNRIYITTNTLDAQCGQADGKAIAVITGGNPPYNITWSNGGNSILVDSLTSGIYVCNVTDQYGCYNFGIATVSDAQAPAIVVNTVVDVTCNGGNDGAIDINVIGNSGPYTYSWNNGSTSEDIAGLVAGPYEVYVTDANGCTATASITVDQPDEVQVSFLVDDATCGNNDGGIFVTANGNSGPFTYVWTSPSYVGDMLGNLGLGVYEVNVIDSEGCIVTQSTTVDEDNGFGGPAIALNSISDLDCNGAGSTIDISVFAAGGTPTYSWSNGATTEDITVTQEGNYTVTVTGAGGCQAIEVYSVDHASPAGQTICMVTVDSIYSVNQVVWEKPSSTDISHFNIYRESSQNGLYYNVGSVDYDSLSLFTDYVANPMITAWRYKISVVDFCGEESSLSESHKTIHLNQNLGLGGTINLIWDQYEGFNYTTYDIIRYTASAGWQVVGNVSSANSSYTDPTPPTDSTLFYVIQVTPTDPCIATRAANNNSTRSNRSQNPVAPPDSGGTTGVHEIGLLEGFAVYPNPNNGLFTFAADFAGEEEAYVSVVSVDGKSIVNFTINGTIGRYQRTLDLSHVAGGVYFIRVQSATSSFAGKIIIEK